jgi:DNA repair protein RadD
MYRQFLKEAKVVNPAVRLGGLTATPYRLGTGSICTVGGVFGHICYEVGVRELIRDGFLCPVVSKGGQAKPDLAGVRIRGGEYVADALEDAVDDDALVRAACAEVVEMTADRKSVLIFAAGVNHGAHVVRILREAHGVEAGFVTGETDAGTRADLLARFRGDPTGDLFKTRAPLKYLVNVNVLTTGFDAPAIDCVVILRPTLSPGLYYQMVGRGFRLSPGKANCLVLDFGGNVERHGPVDMVRPKSPRKGKGEAPGKECQKCHAVVAAGYAKCPECGAEFPPPERQTHEAEATSAGVLSGQVTTERHEVVDVLYHVHHKKNAGPEAPPTMRVDYKLGLVEWKSEWVCFEHEGFARTKAEKWWRQRCNARVPDTVEDAVAIANNGGLVMPAAITVRRVAGEKFASVSGYEFPPEWRRQPSLFDAAGTPAAGVPAEATRWAAEDEGTADADMAAMSFEDVIPF